MDDKYENAERQAVQQPQIKPAYALRRMQDTTSAAGKQIRPVNPYIRMQPAMQFKRFTPDEIRDMIREKYNIELDAREYEGFLAWLASMDLESREEHMNNAINSGLEAGGILGGLGGTALGAAAFRHKGTLPGLAAGLGGTAVITAAGAVVGAIRSLFTSAEVDQYLRLAQTLPDTMLKNWSKKSFEMYSSSQKRPTSMDQLVRAYPGLAIAIETNFRPLRDICGEAGLKNLLETAMSYVSKNILLDHTEPMNAVTCKKYTNIVKKRLETIRISIEKAYASLTQEEKANYYLVPTGSDSHMGGAQVLFMVNKKDSTELKVYKPRSVEADSATVGTNGMFAYINNYLKKEHTETPLLPTREITPSADNTHGTEAFIEKKEHFTHDEALTYYYQMGMLAAASQYLGMSDLHQDNIMPTENGPMITDPEVSFLASDSGITDALTDSVTTRAGHLANAVFSIDGISSIIEYTKENSSFREQYKAGETFMLNKMEAICREDEFGQALRERTAGIRTRIIPEDTLEFTTQYFRYWELGETTFSREFNTILGNNPQSDLDMLLTNIQNCLLDASKKPYYAENREDIKIDSKKLLNALVNSLRNGDVPRFEVQLPKAGKTDAPLFLDNTKIGTATLHFRYEKEN